MYQIHNKPMERFRLLISGFPNTGKTTSLQTFIYGPFDYHEQPEEALEYAAGRKMVVISCPGEFGIRSLPQNSECLTSYYPEFDATGVQWSTEALKAFSALYKEVVQQKPAVLALDGLHALWDHMMNVVTGGDYLEGKELNVNKRTGGFDPYTSARYHSQTHNMFGQLLAEVYSCPLPTVVCTTWEDWEGSVSNETEDVEGKQVGIESKRYLWPSIPGKMAKRVVGRFDARVSARLERRCVHGQCPDSKVSQEHYVWQFMSRGDVRGVGVKGLKEQRSWAQHPYIHQRWDTLQALIRAGKQQ